MKYIYTRISQQIIKRIQRKNLTTKEATRVPLYSHGLWK